MVGHGQEPELLLDPAAIDMGPTQAYKQYVESIRLENRSTSMAWFVLKITVRGAQDA